MFDAGRMYIVYFFIFISIEYHSKLAILSKTEPRYRYSRSKSLCSGSSTAVYSLPKRSGGADRKCSFFYIKRYNNRAGIFV